MTGSARFRLWRRIRAACVLLLHLLVVAGAPLADASARYAPPGAEPHVEAQGSPGCPPFHDHARCQICRAFAWSALLPPPSATATSASHDARGVARSAHPIGGSHAGLSPHGPRAPPRA